MILSFKTALLPAALMVGSGVYAQKGVQTKKVPDGSHSLPNVVLIYFDDLGFGDLGVTGATGYATPNMDRLSFDGMRFTKFYSPAPVSSASRAGLLTGCYPKRIGVEGALSPNGTAALNPAETNIANTLKAKGYRTMVIGKWHVGDVRKFPPMMYGFDEYFGLPYSNDMWPYGHPLIVHGAKLVVEKKDNPRLPFYDGTKVLKYIDTVEDQMQLTTMYTERAVKFIGENAGKPFFLYIAHSMPHAPIACSDKFRGKSALGPYGDVMMELDWSVGEVVRALREAGVEENTLVILTSDNGPWMKFGDYAGTTGGLREAKFDAFEGGQLLGCIMKWPARIPKGVICNKVCCGLDILPTLIDITSAPAPQKPIDGVSILPLLEGDADANPRELFFYSGCRAVRDARFKLVTPHRYTAYFRDLPGMNGQGGRTRPDSIGLSLFDLRRDPGERIDVQALYPEEVKKLKAAIDSMTININNDHRGAWQKKGK